jgi:hypothetical protein
MRWKFSLEFERRLLCTTREHARTREVLNFAVLVVEFYARLCWVRLLIGTLIFLAQKLVFCYYRSPHLGQNETNNQHSAKNFSPEDLPVCHQENGQEARDPEYSYLNSDSHPPINILTSISDI